MNTTKPPIKAGDVLSERYRIDDLLGAGGMSWVFRATDLHLERPVALKVLREVSGHHAGRLKREARAVAALRHPAVVGLHDLGALEDDRPFIVLEFIPGQTLADRLEAGPLEPEHAVALMRPVIAALAEAHAAGIVHRDLKPENLMLQPTSGPMDAVRVLDFGIAAIDPVEGEARYTQTGAVFGTPEFMAPEQALGRRPSPATDVWALGAVLQTLISGESPFTGKHAPEILFKVVQADPEPPPPGTPPDLAGIIAQCLRKAPEERPADAGALSRLLYPETTTPTAEVPVATPLIVATPAIPVQPTAQLSPPKAPLPFRPLAIVAAVSALLGFVLGLALGNDSPPPAAPIAEPAAPTTKPDAPATQAPSSVLAPARTLLAENPSAALAWLDAHEGGDPNERMLLRGRALLADRKTISEGIDQLTAATAGAPGLLTSDLVPPLIDALDDRKGEGAVKLLTDLWPLSQAQLVETAAEGGARARWRAVDAIKAAGGDHEAARFTALLRDLKVGDCDRRERAAVALGKLGDVSALPALRRAKGRGVIDNLCMGSSLDTAIYRLRKIEKAAEADGGADQ